MIRRVAIAVAVVIGVTSLAAGASEPGRRRPVTNPQATIEGVIAAVSEEGLRVQTNAGPVSVSLNARTELVQNGTATPAPGDYTLIDGLVARDGDISAQRVALFNVPSSIASGETVRIEGKVAAVSLDNSELKLQTPGGALLTVTANETTLIRRDGSELALKDVEVGDIVRVVGKATGERTLLALEIDIRAIQQQPHHDMVAGEIVELHAADRTILVRRAMKGPGPSANDLAIVRTDAQTEIYRHNERIRFDEMKPGEFLLAQGDFDVSRGLLAVRIDVGALPEPAPRIAGRVLEVSTTSRQFSVAVERGWMRDTPVGPVTVAVDDATKIYRDREQVRFDSIKAGDFVVISGDWNEGTTTLVASIVRVTTPPDPQGMPSILGEIARIEPATRTLIVRVRAPRPLETTTVGTVKVVVGDETKLFRNGQPIRFVELQPGSVVLVVGKLRDDGTLLATRIDAVVVPTPSPQIMGIVATTGDTSIEIIVPQAYPTFAAVYVTIVADAATDIFRNGERAALSAIKVNDMAFASGEWRDERTFLARKIEAKGMGEIPGPVELHGTIEAIEPGKLRVTNPDGAWAVSATRMTIVTRGNMPIRFESLTTGETVDVKGIESGDRAIVAMLIAAVP